MSKYETLELIGGSYNGVKCAFEVEGRNWIKLIKRTPLSVGVCPMSDIPHEEFKAEIYVKRRRADGTWALVYEYDL